MGRVDDEAAWITREVVRGQRSQIAVSKEINSDASTVSLKIKYMIENWTDTPDLATITGARRLFLAEEALANYEKTGAKPSRPKKTKDPLAKVWSRARDEHAYRLHAVEKLTWHEAALRMGLSDSVVRKIALRHEYWTDPVPLERSRVMAIVKVQRPLVSKDPRAPWLIYAIHGSKQRLVMDKDMDAEVKIAMNGDPKAHFKAEWLDNKWKIGMRAPDHDW